jgi:outer membrane protein
LNIKRKYNKNILKKEVSMKKLVFLSAFMFLLPLYSSAQTKKIGYVDMQAVLLKSKAGKDAKALLDKEKEEKKSTLDKMKEEIEKLQNDINRQSLVLTEEKRKKMEDELALKKQNFLKVLQDYELELQKKDQEWTEKILKEVEKVIYKIGKTEGYDLILEKSAVLYAPEAYDITDKVIREYDKTYTTK